jgi:hypothetical protein
LGTRVCVDGFAVEGRGELNDQNEMALKVAEKHRNTRCRGEKKVQE